VSTKTNDRKKIFLVLVSPNNKNKREPYLVKLSCLKNKYVFSNKSLATYRISGSNIWKELPKSHQLVHR
jgi:hypothetical protein